MNNFCYLGLHKWTYFIEKEGYGKFVPVRTSKNPEARLCGRCCRKEYLQQSKYIRRDPSDSDIREFKINKII